MYREALKQYITGQLLNGRDAAALREEDNLLGAGIVDSVGMMSLVVFIENEFQVEVPPEDVTIEHFRSIETIAAYLQRSREPGAGNR